MDKPQHTAEPYITSFFRGIARVVDPVGLLNEPPTEVTRSPSRTERDAIAEDWKAIGRDLDTAIRRYRSNTRVRGRRRVRA